MTKMTIEERIKNFLVDEMEINPSKINPDARLKEDMGIDSLEVVDTVVFVEREFGFKMKSEEFKDIKTFGQFVDYITEKVG
ncbi:MAG: acyl carrier protein [Bacteroidales bacterium]|nr:acyl carrier protein [Bacteroidales bacterium]